MESNLSNISKLIDFIEENLEDKLDLGSLASSVRYSKYHLHRMFTSIVGIPVHSYVRRRRLTEAARLLTYSNRTIMDIALGAGYETQQSFTRAFNYLFGDIPNALRAKRDFCPFQLKYTVEGIQKMRGDLFMDFKIVESKAISIIGYKASTAKGFGAIGECWENLLKNGWNIPHRIAPDVVIALNDYSANVDCNEEQPAQPAFDYYAAVEVSSVRKIPEGMAAKELPASSYVVFSYRGSSKDSMQPIADYIYKEWTQLNENAMFDFAKCNQNLDDEGNCNVEYCQ